MIRRETATHPGGPPTGAACCEVSCPQTVLLSRTNDLDSWKMSDHRASLRSAGWVNLLSFAQLVVQFAFQTLLARYFGAGAEMDAFVAAISLPTFISSVFFNSLGYALVPVLSRKLVEQDLDSAWSSANNLLTLLGVTTGFAAMILAVFANPLVRLLFPGYAGQQAALTAELVRVLACLIVTNSLIAYSQAVHHSHRRFITPALSPVVGILTTLLIVACLPSRSMLTVAWAVVAGSAVVALLQLSWPLRHYRLRLRPGSDTYQFLRLCAPLILGAAYYRLDPLIDRYLASFLPTGSVAHLGYASRLVTALLMVSSSGLSVVAFPSFAQQQAAASTEGLAREVAHAIRCMIAIIVPIIVGLGCYSTPVIRDLFERGRFTATDTHTVSLLLLLYLGMIVGGAFGDVAAKIFYSLSDTRTPTVIGCIGFTLGLGLKLTLVPSMGVAAIALATSLYYLLNLALMGWLIWKRLGGLLLQGVARACARSLLASLAAVLLAAPVVFSGIPLSSFVGAVAGAGAYFLALFLLKDEMALRLWDYLRHLRGA